MTVTANITVDKTGPYLPGDDIVATINVAGAPTVLTVPLAGHVTLPDGEELPVSGSVPLGAAYSLDPVAGYTITADPAHPGVFTLAPDA